MDQTSPDYSFLNQGDQPSGFFASASKQKRILIVAGGGGILLILSILFAALIFGGGTDVKQNLTNIAQRQQEIIRIAEIAEDSARSQQLLSLATTTKVSMNSAQQKVSNSVSRKGTNLSNADLRLRESQSTTTELSNAEQANRFDETFIEVLRNELTAYQALLETTYDSATGADRQMLEELFADTAVLLETLEEI